MEQIRPSNDSTIFPFLMMTKTTHNI